jgi:hypothetical protein
MLQTRLQLRDRTIHIAGVVQARSQFGAGRNITKNLLCLPG